MATVTGRWNFWPASGYGAELPVRVRLFVWLSTGMFSAAALALAFLGYMWTGTVSDAASNFVSSIVSGGIFGLATVLKFGPVEPDIHPR